MLWVAASAATAGCGSSDGKTAPSDAAPIQRTISVNAVEQRYTASGRSDVAIGSKLSGAYARDATGTFHRISTGAIQNGVFHVSVGDGVVYLELDFGQEFIVAPADTFNATGPVVGRLAVYDPNTSLVLHGDGLLPWRSGDGLEMAIPNHQGGGNRTLILSPLANGATQFGPLDAPLTAPVHASQGDEFWLLQTRSDNAGSVSYAHIVQAAHRGDVEQAAGTTDSTGTLTAAVEQTLALDIRLSQFAALTGTAPGELAGSARLVAHPYGVPQWFLVGTSGASMVSLNLSKLGNDPVVSLSYGNPFPSEWPQYLELTVDSFTKSYALPGADSAVFSGQLHLELPSRDATTAPIVPLVGPARDLLVNGQPPAQAGAVSETPTLAWQAPAFGSAQGYVVSIARLQLSGGTTPRTQLFGVTNIYTAETSVQLVPGILETGKTYFFTVTAVAGAIDVRSAPHRANGAYGTSVAASDTFAR